MELFNYYPFKKLPKELIYIILSYTYQPQRKELTEDIKNYYNIKEIIADIYYNYWIKTYNYHEFSDKEWIINDLFGYANKNKSTILYGIVHSLVDEFYYLFFRKFNMYTKEQVQKYIIRLNDKSLDTQINIYLGLFNPKERNEFISLFIVTKIKSNEWLFYKNNYKYDVFSY